MSSIQCDSPETRVCWARRAAAGEKKRQIIKERDPLKKLELSYRLFTFPILSGRIVVEYL